MILAVDIGNTDIVIGLFKGSSLQCTFRLPTQHHSSLSRCKADFLLLKKIFGTPTGIVITSVVPRRTKPIAKLASIQFHLKPLIVSATLPLGIKIHYRTPSKLGADRLCNAVAASELFGTPCIVVDFGTATTFDVISKQGNFIGGIIAAGIGTSAMALRQRTSKLPLVQLRFQRSVIGKSTVEGIQSGLLYGAVSELEGLIRRIKKITGPKTIVIATGGFSKMISKKTRVIDYVAPSLVLHGARIIFERYKN